MKTRIYWFSGTGNSLAVARELAERCGGAELIPMAEAISNPSSPADRIGLVFPVYGWGPPLLVARFIKTLQAGPETYLFAVVTYAGSPGGTMALLRRLLHRRGLELAAGWGVRMPENYPPLGGAPAPVKQALIQMAAADKLAKIALELQRFPRGRYEQAGAFWRLLSRMVHPLFSRQIPKADRFFRADARCNGCGLCARICPVANIELQNGRPQWNHHCEQCFACFHWCPQKAVQYGRTEKQCRYHHPRSAAADFFRR